METIRLGTHERVFIRKIETIELRIHNGESVRDVTQSANIDVCF